MYTPVKGSEGSTNMRLGAYSHLNAVTSMPPAGSLLTEPNSFRVHHANRGGSQNPARSAETLCGDDQTSCTLGFVGTYSSSNVIEGANISRRSINFAYEGLQHSPSLAYHCTKTLVPASRFAYHPKRLTVPKAISPAVQDDTARPSRSEPGVKGSFGRCPGCDNGKEPAKVPERSKVLGHHGRPLTSEPPHGLGGHSHLDGYAISRRRFGWGRRVHLGF